MKKDNSENSSDQTIPYRIRPRFEIESDSSVQEVVEKLKEDIELDESINAHVSHGYAKLYIVEEHRHYWSPQLTLSVIETETGSLLRGIYGPRAAVWTMFVFFYSIIGFTILIIALFGLTNWSLGIAAPILWLVPVLIIVFLSLYLISFFGQRLGHDQMIILHQFVEQSIQKSNDSK
jgi:hypothetical protein